MAELNKAIDLSQFVIIKYLDEGSFGQVYEVLDNRTGNRYAAKIFHNPINLKNDDLILNLIREVNNNSRFNHPSILQFIGFSLKDFNNNDRPVIITELAGNGSLHNVINYEKKGLSIPGWDDTKKLITIFGIASGMSFLHANNILHRDLKLENILIDERLFPKISDFGFSKKSNDDGYSSSIQSIPVIKGTPAYMAPEIICNQNYTKAGDVFAFGMMVYEIMTTERAFSELGIQEIFKKISNKERPTIENYVPTPYRELIMSCWSHDPKNRPTFDEIVTELQEEKFITPTIEKEDFITYIEFIDQYRTTYDRDKKIISFEDIIQNMQSKTFQRVSIKDITSDSKNARILPESIYFELNGVYQKLVNESINNPEKQFIVGKYLIEGQNGFPKNFEYGMKCLKQSCYDGCIDSAIYLGNMYFKGEQIKQDINEAKKYLLRYEYSNDGRVYNLLGLIFQKENNITMAKMYFHKGCEFNAESMFEYSMILLNEGKNEAYIDEALSNLRISQMRGFFKSVQYWYIYDKLNAHHHFLNLPIGIQHIFIYKIIQKNKSHSIDENDIYNMLEFTGKETLHLEKMILDSNFIQTLKLFSKVSFEIDFPTELFRSILSMLDHIKSKYIRNLDIHVCILNSKKSILMDTLNGCSPITQVTISPTIQIIGNNAFRSCSSLTQIAIPSSVTSIGPNSFQGCTLLTQILIPSIVTSIGPGSFRGCTSLKQISIPSSVTKIESYSFQKCKSLTQISLPSSLTFIGCSIFADCFQLDKILIQQNQEENLELLENMYLVFKESIDKGCFFTLIWAKNNIEYANIPPMVNVLKECALFNHSMLNEISIPPSVESIEKSSFQGCSSLVNISFETPSSLKSIGEDVFWGCSSLVQILIPSSVESIGKDSFRGCSSLERIDFETPSSLKSIEVETFYECLSLKEVTIPTSVKSIGNRAFQGCVSLKKIIIPSSTIVIGNEAFKNCSSLAPFQIPSSVTSIGENIFLGCKRRMCNVQ